MRRDAYPEIGRRITISQGRGEPSRGDLNESGRAQPHNSLAPVACHARESGHPGERGATLDSRFRGNDIIAVRDDSSSLLAPSRRVDDKLVVRPLRGRECVLRKAHKAIDWMIEHAKAAFADLNGLLIPGFCEEGALAPQRLDEDLDLGVAKGAREVGAKFGEQPSRSVLPVGNKLARGGLEKRIAQEVALTVRRPASRERAAPPPRSSSTRSRARSSP